MTSITTPAQKMNAPQATSQLKIHSVFSMGSNSTGQPAPKKDAGQSILKPNPMLQNAGGQHHTPVIRIISPAARQAPNVATNMTAPNVNSTVASVKAPTSNPPVIITKVNPHQKMPVIASIRSYGEASKNRLPIISSIQSGKDVQKSLLDTSIPSASPSTVSDTASEGVTLVEVIPVTDGTPTASENSSEKTSQSEVAMEIIDLSHDEDEDNANIDHNDEEEMAEGSYENDTTNGDDPLSVGRILGFIFCPMNKDLGKIPAEIVGSSITLRIGSCDKEAELPLDLDGNESFECLNTVDKYMSQ